MPGIGILTTGQLYSSIVTVETKLNVQIVTIIIINGDVSIR